MSLEVATGRYSDAGRKPANQDFHGACVPAEPALSRKGVAVAIADGISSSAMSRQASEAAVRSLLDDYYCTSEAWSVKTSVERVLAAANSWLHAQTQQGQGRYDKDQGWVCTLSALVIRSRTAHLFHVGDSRIYQLQGRALEQLTQDHRVYVGGGQSYLGRALGIGPHLEIDYRSVPLEVGDTFLLLTDGVYEHVPHTAMVAALARHGDDLDAAARMIGEQGVLRGSPDNVTVQVVRIDRLPDAETSELYRLATQLPFPPLLEPRMEIDGLRVVRELHASSRSHVYLAVDLDTGGPVVLKAPSIDLRDDPAYLERFLLEEWVARRIDSAYVLRPRGHERRRTHLYVLMEYVEGRTLAQWMVDHPQPELATVRTILEQLARGLRAFHRLEMLHHDLRPANVMIDATGSARIIDFGSVQVAGLVELAAQQGPATHQYAAPEVLLGQAASPRSDQFSLAVIAYQLLSGQLPYGAELARCRSLAEQKRLRYRPLREIRPGLPAWIDAAIRKALDPEPRRRYADVAEFVFCLHQPDREFLAQRPQPLIERHPVAFWKGAALVLGAACVALLGWVARH